MSRWHKHEWDLLPEQAFRPRGGGRMTLEGGKGGNAPPPDPRLVEAQIRSMGIQDDAIQGILDLSRSMQPLQREQMQFGLDSARTAFQQSQADREWNLGRRAALTGLQDTMVRDATEFNTEAKREELAGKAGADVEQAFEGMRSQRVRDMGRYGINPADGAAASIIARDGISKALAKSHSMNTARTEAREEGRRMVDRATGALMGYPAAATHATGAGAQYAASGIGLANQGMAGMGQGYQSAATIAGQMGANAGNAWGQQANYYQRSQEQDNGWMGALGTIGGAAITAF